VISFRPRALLEGAEPEFGSAILQSSIAAPEDGLKKRTLHAFGLALVLASPLWITMEERANYLNFAICLILGLLLLVLAYFSPDPGTGARR